MPVALGARHQADEKMLFIVSKAEGQAHLPSWDHAPAVTAIAPHLEAFFLEGTPVGITFSVGSLSIGSGRPAFTSSARRSSRAFR